MALLAHLLHWIYLGSLLLITAYCLMQVHLLWQYLRARQAPFYGENSQPDLPFVTIQLPVFNERYVVERLIDSVLRLDYPKNKFEVQVLDDSTDDTVRLAAEKVQAYKSADFQIEHIRRQERTGFKAGALKHGLTQAKGEFIAIFDADFLPEPDFLKKTLPHFQHEKTGVVQTRWAHLNENYSLLTRLQAFQLNVHFRVEQQGRQAGGYLLQFNGTAGVWRRNTIEDAGGWHVDTLTEDLDLSIRAQLKGWKITYLENVASPAELPAEMNGLKSQQFRWMKGGAECARKLLPKLWRSTLSLPQKIHGTAQLLGSSLFLLAFLASVVSVPVFFFQAAGWQLETKPFGRLILLGLVGFAAVHFVSNVLVEKGKGSFGKRSVEFFALFPLLLTLSLGLAWHNSLAVAQGWLGKKSDFVRTPKFNILTLGDSFRRRHYAGAPLAWTTIVEGLLAGCFLSVAISAFYLDNLSFLIFHLMLALGYGAIFLETLWHSR